MEIWASIILTAICSVITSSGLWSYFMKRAERDDVKSEMLKGLGHDRIVELGMKYIIRGYITKDEYENLHDYLYVPYEKLNGNGSAKRVMDEVNKLPIRNKPYNKEDEK